jgi:ACS family pantothenate transporter-like MFS transporter
MASPETTVMDPATKAPQTAERSDDGADSQYTPRTRWEKIQEVIWDGGNRTPEERKLVQTLDIHVMSWATFGYFIRLLDSGNIGECYARLVA